MGSCERELEVNKKDNEFNSNLIKKYDEDIKNLRINIFLCGRAGTGKSTFINSILKSKLENEKEDFKINKNKSLSNIINNTITKNSKNSESFNIENNHCFELDKYKCKIYGSSVRTGFFVKLTLHNQKKMPVLITNNHILNIDNIETNKIKITMEDDPIEKYILINKSRMIYTNKDYDITIIEIKPNLDKIRNNNFLDIDEIINYEKNIRKKEIYILQYQNFKKSYFLNEFLEEYKAYDNEINRIFGKNLVRGLSSENLTIVYTRGSCILLDKINLASQNDECIKKALFSFKEYKPNSYLIDTKNKLCLYRH